MNLLHDETIALRAIEPTDLDILYKWENDTTIWQTGCSIAPYSKKEIWDYIENYTTDIFKSNQLRLMITLNESGEAIGTVDLYEFDYFNKRAGVGILIDEAYRHNGYATHALNIIEDYVGKFIGLHQLWATISVENTHSISLFKKCGYKICGRMHSWLRKDKSYIDAFILQKFIP